MSETFDLSAFIDGSSYPKSEVTVYTNVAALKEAEELKALSEGVDPKTGAPLAVTPTAEQIAAWDAKRDLVKVDIEKSALTFELQGMPYRMAQEIADIYNEETPPTEEELIKLVLTTIQGVRDAKGATSTVPSPEVFDKLQKKLSPLEFSKLIQGVIDVNFSAATYEAGIDAGFPGGGSDVE